MIRRRNNEGVKSEKREIVVNNIDIEWYEVIHFY